MFSAGGVPDNKAASDSTGSGLPEIAGGSWSSERSVGQCTGRKAADASRSGKAVGAVDRDKATGKAQLVPAIKHKL